MSRPGTGLFLKRLTATATATSRSSTTRRRLKTPLLVLLYHHRAVSNTSSRISAPLQHGVSHTGLIVAAVRAKEKILFVDPWAEVLAGKEGMELLDDFQSMAKDNILMSAEKMRVLFRLAIAIRHRHFDDFILKALDQMRAEAGGKPLQFVNVASGLDSRAYRLPFSSNVAVFEIDRPEVVEFKRSRLKTIGARPLCKHHAVVAADVVTDEWESALIEAGFDPSRPSVWLTEGLLGYLEEQEVQRLLKRLRGLSVKGSHYGGDWTSKDLFTSSLAKVVVSKLNAMGAPLLSATDNPEASLQAAGWDTPNVAQLGDDKTNYGGAWPYKPRPRWWPSLIPKVWLMTATIKKG